MGGSETGTTTNGPTGEPMYWTIPIGAVLGALVVIGFEALTKRWQGEPRALLGHGSKTIDPEVVERLESAIDGPRNIFEFWSGGLLFARRSVEHLARTYEILSIVCALMLSVCVTFYTASDPDTLFGLVCCVANCALWMATLSSAFFYVVVNSCDCDGDLELLVDLIGTAFFRTPMLLFVWGSLVVFLEFVLYFKLHVDAGFNCSMCLAACFVLVPLFVHCMHKMGWAASVVHAESAVRRRRAVERPATPAQVRAAVADYVATRPVLLLDRDELKAFAEAKLGNLTTSAQEKFLDRLFDQHVDARLDALCDAAEPEPPAVARFRDLEKPRGRADDEAAPACTAALFGA